MITTRVDRIIGVNERDRHFKIYFLDDEGDEICLEISQELSLELFYKLVVIKKLLYEFDKKNV